MRIICIIFCIWGITGNLWGQTDVSLSHKFFGRLCYNPAAAGEDPSTVNLRAFFREQWIGFERAPSTQAISLDNYFAKYHSGTGIVFIKDEIGFSKTLNFKISYSYHLRLNDASYIALGLGAGLIHYSSDERNFTLEDPDDPQITYVIEKETIADFDAGLEYRWKGLSAGFAATHITKSKNNPRLTPHYYGYVNYAMNLTEDWQLTPSVYAAINKRTRVYEICAITEYRSKINVGLAYRVSERFVADAFIGLLGIVVSDYVSLKYSYDFTIGRSKSDVTGAHELVMAFRIKK